VPTERVGCWSTGPALCFVQAAPSTVASGAGVKPTATFLGAGETAPEIIEYRRYKDLVSDYGTRGKIYQDRRALITVKLTYWREAAVSWISRAPSFANPRGVEGSDDVGFITGVNDAAATLWVFFSSIPEKPLFDGHPQGYRFPSTCLSGTPALLRKPGTGVNYVQISWEAVRVFDAQSGTALLYDHNMDAVKSLPIG
jgi:hypothetical protein